MKKTTKLLALTLAVLLALGLAGCGAKTLSVTSDAAPAPAAYPYAESPAESESGFAMDEESGFANTASAGGLYGADDADGSRTALDEPADMSEKIIYSADATLETTEFDAALEKIQALVKELGGFMESTSVSGNNYSSIARGNTGGRYASFTIRVPSDKFSALTGSLSDIGNVPHCSTYMQNVTMEYYDVQSRLEAYKTQETRLLEMLAVAKSVEDMLAIQQQLTEVQYEIDSLTGQLRYYDHQVNYSTVTLYVTEVREYTPEPTITLTYWQRMTRGFSESLKGVGKFFQDLFLWFVTSLPWLVPLAAVIAGVVVLIRRGVKKHPERAARRAEKRAAKAEKRARKAAAKAAEKSAAPTAEPPKSDDT